MQKNEYTKKDLALIIKSGRVAIGLTQKQLCKKTGIKLTTLQNWELGKNEPLATTFLKLIFYLKIENKFFNNKYDKLEERITKLEKKINN